MQEVSQKPFVTITPIPSTNQITTVGTNGFILTVNPSSSSPSINGTNYFTSIPKNVYKTSAIFGNVASLYSSISATSGISYKLDFNIIASFIFGIDGYAANMRMAVGLGVGTAAPINVEPNTLLNYIGICKPAASTNFHIITNDGTGLATLIDLGVNFPANTSQVDVYSLVLFGNNSSVNYIVTRYSSTDGSVLHQAQGVINTDLPVSGSIILPRMFISNNTTNSQVGFTMNKITLGYL